MRALEILKLGAVHDTPGFPEIQAYGPGEEGLQASEGPHGGPGLGVGSEVLLGEGEEG